MRDLLDHNINMNSKILDDYKLAWDSFEAIEEFYFNFLQVLKGFKGKNEEVSDPHACPQSVCVHCM